MTKLKKIASTSVLAATLLTTHSAIAETEILTKSPTHNSAVTTMMAPADAKVFRETGCIFANLYYSSGSTLLMGNEKRICAKTNAFDDGSPTYAWEAFNPEKRR